MSKKFKSILSAKVYFIFIIFIAAVYISGCGNKNKEDEKELLKNFSETLEVDTSNDVVVPTTTPTPSPTATPTPTASNEEEKINAVLDKIQPLAITYYENFFVNKKFDTVYDMFYDKSLEIDKKTKEEFVTEKETYFKSNDIKIVHLNFDKYNIYHDELATLNITLTLNNNGKEEKITEGIHFIKIDGNWKIVYKGQLNIYDFPKVDISDKTKFYMYIDKYIVGVNYVSFRVNVENNTNTEYILGYNDKISEFIVKSDVDTYWVTMNGILEAKKTSQNWIVVPNVQGNISDIVVTKIMESNNGKPLDADYENPKDFIVFKVDK